MPFRWKCSHCGQVFHRSNDIQALDEIMNKFDGRCPKCGKKLARFPKEVKVTPAEKRNTTA